MIKEKRNYGNSLNFVTSINITIENNDKLSELSKNTNRSKNELIIDFCDKALSTNVITFDTHNGDKIRNKIDDSFILIPIRMKEKLREEIKIACAIYNNSRNNLVNEILRKSMN